MFVDCEICHVYIDYLPLQLSSDAVDESVEPQPLWEYPCMASGLPKPLLNVDFTKPVETSDVTETIVQLTVDR
mgnify:CR=1 FL=1